MALFMPEHGSNVIAKVANVNNTLFFDIAFIAIALFALFVPEHWLQCGSEGSKNE